MTESSRGFVRRQLAPGVEAFVQSSQKRKTNTLSFFWHGDLGANVTERALLSGLLTRGTANLPTLKDVTRRLDSLYGAGLSGSVSKLGERHVIEFSMEFANDNYLPGNDGIFEDTMQLLADVLQRPLLQEGVFVDDLVQREKVQHQRLIEGLFNNKGAFAAERCVEEMFRDEEFRRYEYGSVDALEGISPQSLTEEWQSNASSAPVSVFLSGNVAIEESFGGLEKLLEGRNGAVNSLRPLRPLPAVTTVREIEEPFDVNQTKLVLGYRTQTRYDDSHSTALAVASGVLGSGAHSKLFRNVREKESLCYYAHARLDRIQGFMMVSSGIEYAKKERALELIQEQIDDIKNGVISDEELQNTQRSFVNQLTMYEDNPSVMMQNQLRWSVAGVDYDHAANLQQISQVTKQQVVEAMQQVQLDTVYLLRPNDLDGSTAQKQQVEQGVS